MSLLVASAAWLVSLVVNDGRICRRLRYHGKLTLCHRRGCFYPCRWCRKLSSCRGLSRGLVFPRSEEEVHFLLPVSPTASLSVAQSCLSASRCRGSTDE